MHMSCVHPLLHGMVAPHLTGAMIHAARMQNGARCTPLHCMCSTCCVKTDLLCVFVCALLRAPGGSNWQAWDVSCFLPAPINGACMVTVTRDMRDTAYQYNMLVISNVAEIVGTRAKISGPLLRTRIDRAPGKPVVVVRDRQLLKQLVDLEVIDKRASKVALASTHVVCNALVALELGDVGRALKWLSKQPKPGPLVPGLPILYTERERQLMMFYPRGVPFPTTLLPMIIGEREKRCRSARGVCKGCLCVCAHVFMYVCTCTHVCVCVCTCTCVCVCAVCAHVCVRTHVYMHVCCACACV